MEKLTRSFKSLSPDHHPTSYPEEEHQILLNKAERSNFSMDISKPKDFLSHHVHNIYYCPWPREKFCSAVPALLLRKIESLVNRTKSRLMDPLEQDQRSQNVAMKSGVLLKDSEIEEDDHFSDEDLPEEYKKVRFSPLTVLQLGRLVSGWGIRLVVFFIESNFLLRKRVLYFVYGLRNSVQNCIWLSLVLIAWQCIFDKKVDKMTGGKEHEEEKVMAEVQKLQSAGATLPADLKASIFARPIGTPRKTPTSATLRSSAFSRVISEKEKEKKNEGGITIDHLHRLNQKNVSAWNMKRLMNMVRKGVLSTG
ncbi:hypothetical protein HAX54_038101 [Datura stramonium]|uniref:Uncharacterized protein n=1 Tax=Datura stramonium TaxID=4076 RepID=A0ABS8SI03_DATST|nr:hypothetical protein [Datura stramonium]